MPVRWLVWSAALVLGIGGGIGIAVARQPAPDEAPPGIPAARHVANPRLDPGTPLNAVAPDFTLTDQFGKAVSLHSFRGKVVVVSFNDPECTTICPLTTTALLEAKKLLGPAGTDVQLLGIGANPDATQVKSVRAYSRAHQMMRKWLFLTGSLRQMKHVWSSYGVLAAAVQGTIDHTPATYIIDPNGRETRLFITQMSYSSVPQLAVVLARAIAAHLPGHPRVRSATSLATIPLIGPGQRVVLKSMDGSRPTKLGPGTGAHLLLFFNTWEEQVTHLRAHLKALNGYARRTTSAPLVAIDEVNVEPTPDAWREFFYPASWGRAPIDYRFAIDPDGRVADGYGVQDSPWLTLVSGSGKILWSHDVAARGWPSTTWLAGHIHAALAQKGR